MRVPATSPEDLAARLVVDIDRRTLALDALHTGLWTRVPWLAAAEGSSKLDTGARIAGRYRVQETLGRGGFGRVYRCHDEVERREVAVKVMDTHQIAAEGELAVLRLLVMPGVAVWRDDGEHEGQPFLVMDLIDGERFPSGPVAHPEVLGETVLGVLETLARVHELGVVHRDIKPGNVLVDPQGRAVLLDFGIARSDRLGVGASVDGIIGTPAYLAPEQLLGGVADARTDLFALGVMLYRALAGVYPLPDDDLAVLAERRVRQPAPSLGEHRPDLAPELLALVDDLLARDPGDRPSSAVAVIGRWRGWWRPNRRVARLGSSTLPMDVLTRGRTAPVTVGGARGCGRSRLLDDVADMAQARGLEVIRLMPDPVPLASVVEAVAMASLDALPLDEVVSGARAMLQARVDAGALLLVDDVDKLDRWSRAVVDGLTGGRIQASEGPTGDFVLEPLSEGELRPLFAGPDVVLHLREDAARALHEATGGVPARVVEELASWVRAGLATPGPAGHAVEREALYRLSSGLTVDPSPRLPEAVHTGASVVRDLLEWLSLLGADATESRLSVLSGLPVWLVSGLLSELGAAGAVDVQGQRVRSLGVPAGLRWTAEQRATARSCIVDLLAEGEGSRLEHLLALGRLDEAVHEALVRTEAALARHDAEGAWPVAWEGLGLARRRGDQEAAARLLDLCTLCALVEVRGDRLEVLAWRAFDLRDSPRADQLRWMRAALTRGGSDVVDALRDLPTHPDPRLEWWRWQGRAYAARRSPVAVHEAAMADLFAARSEGVEASGRLLAGRATLASRMGRFAEAATLHGEAARVFEGGGLDALPSRLNQTVALSESGALKEALAQAERGARLAASARRASLEAYFLKEVLGLRYRLGGLPEVDPELVEVVATLGWPMLHASLLAVRKVVAWRRGTVEPPAIRALARRWRDLDRPDAAAVFDALALVVAPSSSSPAALLDAAQASPYDGLATQTAALVGRARPELVPELRERFGPRVDSLLGGDPRHRREVLSLAEILSVLRPEAAEATHAQWP